MALCNKNAKTLTIKKGKDGSSIGVKGQIL